jgi:hypothetical protein
MQHVFEHTVERTPKRPNCLAQLPRLEARPISCSSDNNDSEIELSLYNHDSQRLIIGERGDAYPELPKFALIIQAANQVANKHDTSIGIEIVESFDRFEHHQSDIRERERES